MAVALEPIRYTLGVRSGSGAPPPTLRNVDTEHGKVDLAPTATTRSKPAPSLRRNEGRVEFNINARSIEEAAWQTAHMARRAGVKTREELMANVGLPAQIGMQKIPFTQPVMLHFSMGAPEHLRSIAKTALETLALAEPAHGRSAELQGACDFIANEGHPDRAGWIYTPGPPLPFAVAELGEFAHSVVVWGHSGSPLVAVVTLFGHLRFAVCLAETWSGPTVGIAHAVNPIAGRLFNLTPLAQIPAPADLSDFDARAVDDETRRLHFANFIEKLHAHKREEWLGRVARSAVEPVLATWKDGDIIDDAKINQLSNAVTTAYMETKLGYSRPIDSDDFLARVCEEFDRLAERDLKCATH